MLVELSVVEQRYQAVLAVIRDGVPIVEVASRMGVSRQAVHRWAPAEPPGSRKPLYDGARVGSARSVRGDGPD
jgi:transposase